jgi:hypothetical protein
VALSLLRGHTADKPMLPPVRQAVRRSPRFAWGSFSSTRGSPTTVRPGALRLQSDVDRGRLRFANEHCSKRCQRPRDPPPSISAPACAAGIAGLQHRCPRPPLLAAPQP